MDDAVEDAALELLTREELEDRVRHRTAELENVLDTMADVLVRTDAQGRITLVNDAASSLLGYEEEDLLGEPVDVLFPTPPAEAAGEDRSLLDVLSGAGQVTDVEVPVRRADGTELPMSLSASTLVADGTVEGLVCVATDITERRRAAEREEFLQSLLRHDLGNKLQIVSGSLTLLAETDLDEDQRAELHRALSSVEESQSLIETVRTIGELGEAEGEAVPLADVVRGSLERYESSAAERGVTLQANLEAEPAVAAGPILPELVDNLVENALLHSEGDTVVVSVTADAETATLSVADDGKGVPHDLRTDIASKGVKGDTSPGSGLGLHLVQRIAESYDATLQVGEADLGGARFDVTFDRAG